MKKYIIRWNVGYGDEYETVNASNEDCATRMAYFSWKEAAEEQADYEVQGEWTKELAEDFGIE